MRITLSSHIRIKNEDIIPELSQFIQGHLTFSNPKYKNAIEYSKSRKAEYIPKFIEAFHTTERYTYISRGFLRPLLMFLDRKKVKYKLVDKTVTSNSGLMLPRIKLRTYQKNAAVKAIRLGNGVIKMPCGAGKTITLTDVIRRLQQHTLIIVHTNFIMNQWKNYFLEKYGYEPGVIQGDTSDIKPITIAMIPTLYQRHLSKKFLKHWGCVVVDETHRVPADSFFNVVNLFPAKYRFGTTATARRNDGLTDMIFATLGEIIYNVKASTLSRKHYLTIPKVKIVNTSFIARTNQYQNVIKELCANRKRNALIIKNLYRSKDRFNLVLSSRIEHLQKLVNEYAKLTGDYELVTGSTKAVERNEIIARMVRGDLHTVFSTQLADEGLDIPNLDTVHLVYPTKADSTIEQRIGRVQRYKDHTPLVYDYVDQLVPKFYNFTSNRLNLYRELELEIEEN